MFGVCLGGVSTDEHKGKTDTKRRSCRWSEYTVSKAILSTGSSHGGARCTDTCTRRRTHERARQHGHTRCSTSMGGQTRKRRPWTSCGQTDEHVKRVTSEHTREQRTRKEPGTSVGRGLCWTRRNRVGGGLGQEPWREPGWWRAAPAAPGGETRGGGSQGRGLARGEAGRRGPTRSAARAGDLEAGQARPGRSRHGWRRLAEETAGAAAQRRRRGASGVGVGVQEEERGRLAQGEA